MKGIPLYRYRTVCNAVVTVAVLLVAAGCHRPDDVIPDGILTLSETSVDVGWLGRYCTLSVNGMSDGDSIAVVTPDAAWVTHDRSFGTHIVLYVQPNDTERQRKTTVDVRTARGLSATLDVVQHSTAENDNNALDEGALTRYGRVGYGYNMLLDYTDIASASDKPVFDYDALVAAERDYGIIIGQEPNSSLNYQYYTSYSIYEMATRLMKEQTDEVSFLGLSKKTYRYTSVKSFDAETSCYGYAKLTKVVATRYLDMGKVDELLRRQDRYPVLAPDFRAWIDRLRDGGCAKVDVENFVSAYGTHVIIYADLGGRLDYDVNYVKHQTNREEMERFMQYSLGKLKSDKTIESTYKNVSEQGGVSVYAYGGDETTRKRLKVNLRPTDITSAQLSPDAIADWAASIDLAHLENISLADCRLIPIWQVLPDEEMRAAVRSHILDLAEQLSGQRKEELGLNNYIAVSLKNLRDFGGAESLVKLAYNEKIPKFEICNEYVPELRGDQRVTIIYPIYQGKTNIRHGIFAGDSVNTPSEISFDDVGGVYIQPLEGCKAGQVLDTLYYIDGALYGTDYGIETRVKDLTVVPEWLKINGHVKLYPVVKIGHGFWTRCPLADRMGFGNYQSASWTYKEQVVGGVLYADVYYPKNPMYNRSADFGTDEGLWYIPSIDDLDALYTYVGRNPKTLFAQQQTGFDATFDGCLTSYDFLNDKPLGDVLRFLYKGEAAFIPFKNDRTNYTTGGRALVLKPDYSLTEVELRLEKGRGRYAVRPFRNSMFVHKNLQ